MNIPQVLQKAVYFHQQGQLDKAQAIYESILQVDKQQSDAHNLLGALFVTKKEFKKAEKYLIKALKSSPNYAPIHYNLGKCYSEAQQFRKALRPIQKSLQLSPDNPEALFLLGNVFVQMGQQEKALSHYKKLLLLIPNHLEALINLANAHYELKNYEQAVNYYQQVLEVTPNHQPACLGLAISLSKVDKQQQAIAVLDQAIVAAPHAQLFKAKGNYHEQLGEMTAAKEAFKQAIQYNPKYGGAYRSFSDVAKSKQPEDIDVIESGFQFLDKMSDEDKMHLYFAQGNMQDSLGNYPQAIAAYDQANQLKRSAYQYRLQEDKKVFQAIEKNYHQLWFDSLGETQKKSLSTISSPEKKLIFIVGMPRSGTTLVEQIIASHSQVTGAGELVFLGLHAKLHKQGESDFHQKFALMTSAQRQYIADDYYQNVVPLAADTPVVTDKMPHNFLNLGMIAALFPHAKIIHCKRHPVANCLSIYKQYFSAQNSHPYAYQQKELAQYHNLYEHLMQHWRNVMGGRFYEIAYEVLTTNQEEESRRLIDYCSLDWQDACLDFYKAKRKVKTASVFQVRQPMSTQSVNLWQKYGNGLQPLIDHLYIPEDYQ